jgi:hypothetical protein
MQKRKPPAFQEYPAEMLAKREFKLMNLHEKGLLYLMRLECWVNKSIPSQPSLLAKYLGFNDSEISIALTENVKSFFSEEFGNFRSIELDNYKDHLEERRLKQSEGGKNGVRIKREKNHNQGNFKQTYQVSSRSLVKNSQAQTSTEKTNQEQSINRDDLDDEWVREYDSA